MADRPPRAGASLFRLGAVLAAVMAAFLFIGGPGYYSPRSFARAWDLGHIALFFLLTELLLQLWRQQGRNHSAGIVWWTLTATLLVGALVELLQSRFGRLPDAGDVARDLLGTLLALAFRRQPAAGEKLWPRRLGQIAALLMLGAALVPPARALLDEYRAAAAFPLLGSFETAAELDRWTGDASTARVGEVYRDGKMSLEIALTTATYSGVHLKYFPRDWRGYDALQFSVFNPGRAPLALTCRVHDRAHIANGQHYSDRFNRRLTIRPGWNDLAIPLEDIRLAPDGRVMDLSRIGGVGLFGVRLFAPAVVYLDRMRLVKQPAVRTAPLSARGRETMALQSVGPPV